MGEVQSSAAEVADVAQRAIRIQNVVCSAQVRSGVIAAAALRDALTNGQLLTYNASAASLVDLLTAMQVCAVGWCAYES